MSPRNPMALRLSANLMVGIARIHSQQTHYIYGTECVNKQGLKDNRAQCKNAIKFPLVVYNSF